MSTPKTSPMTFSDFHFSPEMNRAISELGFETPTPVQEQTIPLLLKGSTDFLGLASTGTGKTAAYAIPILEQLDPTKKGVQSLILCPTRELAKQVAEQFNLLARYKKTKALAIYGGAHYGGQLKALKEGVSIVVGTPGRIIDHLERKTLNLDQLQTVVLDEADEMISMGFREEIETILSTVKQEVKHQTWLFSATMSRDVRKIADQFLHKAKQVQIEKTTTTAASVTQSFFQVQEHQKPGVIENLIDSAEGFYGLIFCQTKASVIELTESLRRNGYAADCLHGDMEQNAREKIMRAFKERTITILICTDVASRGIDVKDLTHVINYSLPRELDLYIHRIGRTGRGGKSGVAWNLVTPSHQGLVSRIERETKTRMTRAQLPTQGAILKLKVSRALSSFLPDESRKTTRELIQNSLADTGWTLAIETMSKEEIVAKFLAQSLKLPAPVESQPKTGFVSKNTYHERRARKFDQRREERRGPKKHRTLSQRFAPTF